MFITMLSLLSHEQIVKQWLYVIYCFLSWQYIIGLSLIGTFLCGDLYCENKNSLLVQIYYSVKFCIHLIQC